MKISDILTQEDVYSIAQMGFACLGDLSEVNMNNVIDFRGEVIYLYNMDNPLNAGKFHKTKDGEYYFSMVGPEKPVPFLTISGYVDDDNEVITHLQFDAKGKRFNCIEAVKQAVGTGKTSF